jgi:hypothetical protein
VPGRINLTWASASAWSLAVLTVPFDFLLHIDLGPVRLILVGGAMTATLAAVVTARKPPIEEAFLHGYQFRAEIESRQRDHEAQVLAFPTAGSLAVKRTPLPHRRPPSPRR